MVEFSVSRKEDGMDGGIREIGEARRGWVG